MLTDTRRSYLLYQLNVHLNGNNVDYEEPTPIEMVNNPWNR